MVNKKFSINEDDLAEAKNKAQISYKAGYSKDGAKANKGSLQVYYSGFKEAIIGSIEYYEKGYIPDMKRSHNNHGFYVVFTKPDALQQTELQALYNQIEDQFKSNLAADKRLYVEQQIAFEESEKQAELDKIKERELTKKIKMKEALVLKMVAAL